NRTSATHSVRAKTTLRSPITKNDHVPKSILSRLKTRHTSRESRRATWPSSPTLWRWRSPSIGPGCERLAPDLLGGVRLVGGVAVGGDGGLGGRAIAAHGDVDGAQQRQDVGVLPPSEEEVVGAERHQVDAVRPHGVSQQHHPVVGAVGAEHLVAPIDLIPDAAGNGHRDDVEYRDRLGHPPPPRRTYSRPRRQRPPP